MSDENDLSDDEVRAMLADADEVPVDYYRVTIDPSPFVVAASTA